MISHFMSKLILKAVNSENNTKKYMLLGINDKQMYDVSYSQVSLQRYIAIPDDIQSFQDSNCNNNK